MQNCTPRPKDGTVFPTDYKPDGDQDFQI